MASPQVLSAMEVREFVSDYASNNHLIDGVEFSDSFITLSMELAIDEFNLIPPTSLLSLRNFPSKSILLNGTLWKMFDGKATLLARNSLNGYTDGGLTIPLDEARIQYYLGLAESFRAKFVEASGKLKIHSNMESGWGSVSSDEAFIPSW